MIVFKTFLKVLKKSIVPVLLYTIILLLFGGFNMQTSEMNTNFEATKPNIYIVNEDEDIGLTRSFIQYMEQNANLISSKNTSINLKDALFYREISYIIYIPKNFRTDFLNHKKKEIKIESTNDYQASLANMMVERYLKVVNSYNQIDLSEEEMIEKTESTLKTTVDVNVTSKLDTKSLSEVTYYYNFASYSILAGCVYAICLILSSFKQENIKKRTNVSSMNYKYYNRMLLLANALFALVLWFLYVVISIFMLGNIMFTPHGLCFIINSLLFTLTSLTFAFLIGNAIHSKEAINGIVNVVALGSSFLCGAFVPMELLPDSVLQIAHILPTYWYIKNNELLKSMEEIHFDTLKPIVVNMFVMIVFVVVFILLNDMVSKRNQERNERL